MGKPNVVTKQYMKDNARFADACNFFLFHGEQMIKPEDLAEKDVTELALPKGLKGAVAIEKIRDVLKGCCVKTAGGVTYLIVGVENQADVHYAMVIRNMLYDALNYSSNGDRLEQALEMKKERWSGLGNEEIELLNMCLDAKLKITEDMDGKGEDNKVCRGIEEYAAKRKAEGKAEGERLGMINTLAQLVRDGLLSLSVAAERAQMTMEEFQKQM